MAALSQTLRKCLCLIIGLVVLISAMVGILFLAYRPKLPELSIGRTEVTQFDITKNSSLSATIDVTINITNPNKKVGIYYEGGSQINVWYKSTKLCEGSWPEFYQGQKNLTVLVVPLTGQIEDATGLMTALQEQQQQTGTIPLNLKVKQDVRVELGKLKIKIKFSVTCQIDVDGLLNKDIIVRNNTCKFKYRL